MAGNIFLTAAWRKLAMANYEVDKSLLQRYLPYKTEIDTWNNISYVSLVGFMFVNTKLRGVAIPFHSNFEEVNLRFYVRFKDEKGSWKRGVVFIKEIVPKPALTMIANVVYGENYETMKMNHRWHEDQDSVTVEYHWKKGRWNSIKVIAKNRMNNIDDGSEEEFITEHFWGYTFRDLNKTTEYQVEHPRWKIYPVITHTIDVDFENIYGQQFGCLNQQQPTSVFLAEGSEIIVRQARTV